MLHLTLVRSVDGNCVSGSPIRKCSRVRYDGSRGSLDKTKVWNSSMPLSQMAVYIVLHRWQFMPITNVSFMDCTVVVSGGVCSHMVVSNY